MKRTKFSLLLALPLVLLLIGVTAGLQRAGSPAVEMRRYATVFLDSLSEEQVAMAKLPYDSAKRVDWHFIPKPERKGVVIRDMNAAQKIAAMRLIRASLSQAGYEKTSQIMLLEGILRQLEGPGSEERRDPQKYYVTIFGDPAQADESEHWGLSFEGHHLSLNFVCSGDEVVDSSPQFMGANPAVVKSDVTGLISKGTRVLQQEETLGFELVKSLDDGQENKAIIADEAPAEIRFAGEAQPEPTDPEGIDYGSLNAEQQKVLQELITVYAKTVPADVAEARLQAINANDWNKTHFAWAGAQEPGIGHYYRIQGPTFLIEFVNTQPDPDGNPANHIHCVWRDVTGDFGLPIE
ncbi:MAG: DUF3500 domain-containing protein [Pirellulaceae bacterium]